MNKHCTSENPENNQIDVSRRRVTRLIAAVTVLGTGLGVSMREVFAADAQHAIPPDAYLDKAPPVMMGPGANQSKSTPVLARPGTSQSKSTPVMIGPGTSRQREKK